MKGIKALKVRMCWNAKRRAAKAGVPFTITVDDIYIPSHCPVLGLKLEPNKGRAGDNSPSLDRIHPELGYVPGNIIVVSHKANSMKGNGTAEEHRKLLAWLEQVTGDTPLQEVL